MTDCVICQHPKIHAINAALASGRSPNLVRAQYRLEPQMLGLHCAHRTAPIAEIDLSLPRGAPLKHLLDKPLPVVQEERPLTRVKQAWQDTKDDQAERARIVAWINDQLQADDMGLP